MLNKIHEFIYWFSGCSDYELRLVGGTSSLQGRVEICLGNIWGTVCDDRWDNADASVVCGFLGYSRDGTLVMYCKINAVANSMNSIYAFFCFILLAISTLCTQISLILCTDILYRNRTHARALHNGKLPTYNYMLMKRQDGHGIMIIFLHCIII